MFKALFEKLTFHTNDKPCEKILKNIIFILKISKSRNLTSLPNSKFPHVKGLYVNISIFIILIKMQIKCITSSIGKSSQFWDMPLLRKFNLP